MAPQAAAAQTMYSGVQNINADVIADNTITSAAAATANHARGAAKKKPKNNNNGEAARTPSPPRAGNLDAPAVRAMPALMPPPLPKPQFQPAAGAFPVVRKS